MSTDILPKFRSDFNESVFILWDIKPVNMIILMEKSSKEFTDVAPKYLHKMVTTYSSGAKVMNLEGVLYVSLDTYKNIGDNNIDTMLDAWMTFFTTDDPDTIMKLVTKYPEFLSIYNDIAEFRKKPGEVVGLFSEALRELDRREEFYMVDDLKEMIAEREKVLSEKEKDLAEKEKDLAEKEKDLAEIKQTLADKDQTIAELTARIKVLESGA